MKIANKINLYFLIAAIILTVPAASYFYYISQANLTTLIDTQLDTMVASRKHHLETYLALLEVSVGQLSKSVVLENLLEAYEQDPLLIKESFDIAMKRLSRTKEANPAVYNFLLLDTNGRVIAANNRSDIGKDKSGDAYFVGGQKQTYIKDAYYDAMAKEGLLAVATPFLDSNTNQLRGVLVAEVRLGELYKIVTDTTGLGKTGEVYLVNKYGYMITPSRTLAGTFLKQKVDTLNAFYALETARSGNKAGPEIIIGPNYRDVKVIGANAYLPQVQWAILAEVEVSEAMRPLAVIWVLFIFIIIIVPVAAWLLGRLISRMITGSIDRLHKGVEIIGKGNLDYRVGTDAKDEIGELSRAFDAMVIDLQHSTTSIENLNNEISLRRQTEGKLRRNEEWLSITLRSIGDAVIATDSEGKVVFFNDVAQKLTGYSNSEAINKPLKDVFRIINELTGKEVESPVEKVLREGIIVGLGNHVVLKAKDGTRRPIDDSAAPIKNEQGKVSGVVLVFRDVTEHRRKDEELQRLAGIVQSTGEAIIGKDLNGIITSWNKGAQDMYGFSAQEAIGKSVELIIPRDHRQEMFDIVDKIKKGEEVISVETVRLTKEGKIIDVYLNASAIRDIFGKVIGVSAIAHDITQTKKISKQMQELAEEWQRTFDSISDMVFIQGEDFKILRANKRCFEVLKADPKDVIGKKCYEVFHSSDKPWPKCPFVGTKANSRPNTEEVFDPHIGMPLLVTVSPVFNSDGDLIGAVHVAKDITEMKIAQQRLQVIAYELEKSNRELRQLDQLKSDFVSTVSHELRTPLSIIKEGVSLIMDKIPGKINDKQNKILFMAKDNIDRLARIINNLLDISKIESGRLDIKRTSVNVTELIGRSVEEFKLRAKEKGLELKADLGQESIEIYADADKIIQILANLLNNALKFTEKGSVEVSLKNFADKIECSVVDTGIGIAKENIPKVFGKFQQFARPIGGAGDKGTGLGLAIAQDLIAMHSGKIWVESELGKGTKFTFMLPKFNSEMLFHEHVNNFISTARSKNTNMSLIIFSIDDFKQHKELSRARLVTILEEMKEHIDKNILRGGDNTVISIEAGEIVILLADCNKNSVLQAEDRVMQGLVKYIVRNGLSNAVKLRTGRATYPDDGSNAQELFSKAESMTGK